MLELLKDVKSIDGFNVLVIDELREKHPEMFNESGQMDYKRFESEIRPNFFIYVRNDVNSLSFTLQKSEDSEDGCRVDTIIEAAKLILQCRAGCREKSIAITKLDEALMWLKKRKDNLFLERVRKTLEENKN